MLIVCVKNGCVLDQLMRIVERNINHRQAGYETSFQHTRFGTNRHR